MSENSGIPTSWITASMSEICTKIHYGFTDSSDENGSGTKFLRITDIQNDCVNWDTVPRCSLPIVDASAYLLQKGDILFARTGGTVGKSFLIKSAPPDAIFASYLIRLVPSKGINPPYIAAFFKSAAYWRQINLNKTGLKTNVNASILGALTLPLPPLAEQKRIVAKIEELFSELDAGEASLRQARQQLGVYRQSLLKQAFEGKLTEKWRAVNPDASVSHLAEEIPSDELKGFSNLPATWQYTRLGQFIHHIDAGKSFRCEERRPSTTEIGVAKVSAVSWGEYDEAESKTCIDPDKVNPDYFIRAGDFVLSRANTIELVGACVIVRKVTQRIMLSDKTLRLTIDEPMKRFILHYLRSHLGRREIEKRSTGNQESMRNIGQERIRSIIIPRCPLPEQQEIVHILDAQFEAIEQNEREIDQALRKSEALRQSILKKAFSGQLVPQDPSDEPASALLARLKSTRETLPTPKRKTTCEL